MLRILAYLFVGVPAGFVAGCAWIGGAMAIAGGGNSHNDTILLFVGGLLGGVFGPFVWPLLRNLRGPDMDDRRRAPGTASRIMLFSLAVVALFLATSLHYYAEDIANLSPESGGPVSEIPGSVRRVRALWGAAAAFLSGIALGSIALWPRAKATVSGG